MKKFLRIALFAVATKTFAATPLVSPLLVIAGTDRYLVHWTPGHFLLILAGFWKIL